MVNLDNRDLCRINSALAVSSGRENSRPVESKSDSTDHILSSIWGLGPKGQTGTEPDPEVELTYAGLKFSVRLKKSTTDMLDTDEDISKEDLKFVEMMDADEYSIIHKAWKKAYLEFLADEAFESGEVVYGE